ncbi:DUF4143 domain-containing protein [Spirosoma sp. KNUC1025]|nr:DUF4143 domain-containing protein [Spirosoma sp. KNUC1025]
MFGKRLVKAPKVFIRDSGLVHRLVDINDYNALAGNLLLGGSWEGYVVQQIISRLTTDVTPFYYRTQNGAAFFVHDDEVVYNSCTCG